MTNSLSNLTAVAATAIVSIAVLLDLRKDIRRTISGRTVVLMGIFIWFLMDALLLSPIVRTFSQQTYDFGVFCVVLSTVGFLLGYHLTRGCRLMEPIAAKIASVEEPRLLWRLVLFAGIVGFAPILYFSGLDLVRLLHDIIGLRTTWGGIIGRGRYGGFREALLQLENLVNAVAPLAVILLLKFRTDLRQKAVCLLVVCWPILRAFGGGTRHHIFFALGPILGVLYYRLGPRAQRIAIIVGLLLIAPAFTLMAAIGAGRNAGAISWEAGENTPYVGNEMFQELLFITSTVPESEPYGLGYSYYVQLCTPVPRFLWPGKPSLEIGIRMAQLKGEIDRATGETYLTRSPGLIGEMYVNFGLPGVFLLSLLGGWLVRGWDRVVVQYDKSVVVFSFYLFGLVALFFIGRSFSATAFYNMIFLYLAVYLVTKFAGSSGGRSAMASLVVTSTGSVS
jgi:oligosaccharide repeat unit polymerase